MLFAICVLVVLCALAVWKVCAVSSQLDSVLTLSDELIEAGDTLLDLSLDLVNDLEKAEEAKERWKSYALAYETLVECLTEYDETGAENAQSVLQQEREALQRLGEYDE